MIASAFAAERLLFTPATPDTDAIPTIFAFPNEYSVGITSLGYQVVWATLAMRMVLQGRNCAAAWSRRSFVRATSWSSHAERCVRARGRS